jgi:sugar lactone lactonase YvrE
MNANILVALLQPVCARKNFWRAGWMALILAQTSMAGTTNFTLYVANYLGFSGGSGRPFTIEEFNDLGIPGVFATNTSFSSPILSSPAGLAIDSSSNIYVLNTQDGSWIEKFDPWGNNAVLFAGLSVGEPDAMVFDSVGNLYVATGANAIDKVNPSGVVSVYSSASGAGSIVGLAFDAGGNLYASDEYNGIIEIIPSGGGAMTTFASPGGNPYGMAFDTAGDLFVPLRGNGTILKYPFTEGTLSATPSTFASLGASTQPAALAFDPAGNLYVSEYSANAIVKIDPQGNVTTFATAGLNGPGAIVLQPKPFSMDRSVIAGGGGTSSGGTWSVTGIIGQIYAADISGEYMQGQQVGLAGGFFGSVYSNLPESTNLIENGSFEFGYFTDNHGNDNAMSLFPGGTSIFDWTVTGPGSDLAWIGPDNDLGLTAADGSYFLDLTGYHNSPPWNGVSQTIPTTVGQTYHVSYEIGYSSGYDGSTMPQVAVSVTGMPTFTNSFSGSGVNSWETFAFSFTAIASQTTISFSGTNAQGLQYIGLDNVIMWAGAVSAISMSAPSLSISQGLLVLPFLAPDGSGSFELLQSQSLNGSWILNSQALVKNLGPNAYSISVPIPLDSAFYRVQAH